jgi:hypothetical protein
MSTFKDVTITANAIENLLNSYADHKSVMKVYEEENNVDIKKLENDAEYMYHRGFCEAYERWIESVGISPNSPAIEKMVEDFGVKRQISNANF